MHIAGDLTNDVVQSHTKNDSVYHKKARTRIRNDNYVCTNVLASTKLLVNSKFYTFKLALVSFNIFCHFYCKELLARHTQNAVSEDILSLTMFAEYFT